MIRFSSEFLWHRRRRIQHSLQLNYDITPERGFGGRLVYRDGNLNVFFIFFQTVRKGVDAYLILGDPNAETMRKRGVAKLVIPLK